jgi:hypothetical protein
VPTATASESTPVAADDAEFGLDKGARAMRVRGERGGRADVIRVRIEHDRAVAEVDRP